MVDAVRFKGTDQVSRSDVAPLVETERTGLFRRWFGWKMGSLTCLDSVAIVSDAAMIEAVYHDRGFLAAKVTASVARRGERRAQVTFTIREGLPAIITTVLVSGLPPLAADSAAVVRRLRGTALDDSVVHAVADSIQAQIRDAGYARALPHRLTVESDSGLRVGTVTLGFRPGVLTWIGRVDLKITPAGPSQSLSDRAVRAAFGVQRGDQFSARRIAAGQRAVGALDLYRQIRVDTVPATRDTAVVRDTAAARDTIGLALSLTEGDRKRARTTAGWGTLDCFRTQGRFVEQNFFSLGHRFELNARLSKIGLAAPFSGLESLCATSVREDPFSQRLNYYAGATTRLRGIRGWGAGRWQPELTIFSERRSSVGVYEQTTEIGALASSTHLLAQRLSTTLQYAYTDTRTRADRAVSCRQFGFCRLEDVASFVLRSPQHSISGSLVKNQLLLADEPSLAYRWQLDAKYGHAAIGGILPIDFGRVTGEIATYQPIASWVTLALRAQVGAVIAPADRSFLLPPAERLYGGGQNSVRGYGQNQLGPGSFIVNAIDTVAAANGTQFGVARADVPEQRIAPSGGNAMWIANVEFRSTRGWPNDLLRWVLFVDAGRVWNTNDVFAVTNAGARITPGFGVRLVTPLGPFRVDVGYNPNSADRGPAFFIVDGNPSTGVAGRAICVSPGTDDPLVLRAGQSSSSTSCPATFLPPRSGKLLSRLTFHFSLGQAF